VTLALRAARALGWRPEHWRAVVTGRVPGVGAGHWIVGDAAGRTAFLKIGTTPVTVDWIRAEARKYADSAVIIDWNHAAVGDPRLDLAFWLPSLHAEGGPPPDELMPDADGLAAWVAGFFCARAGDPPIPDATHVRPLQVRQARTALPWAARALGLPPPD
jgi:hypothetical protein